MQYDEQTFDQLLEQEAHLNNLLKEYLDDKEAILDEIANLEQADIRNSDLINKTYKEIAKIEELIKNYEHPSDYINPKWYQQKETLFDDFENQEINEAPIDPDDLPF